MVVPGFREAGGNAMHGRGRDELVGGDFLFRHALLAEGQEGSKLVQRMEEQGLLRRETGAADRRQVRLRLHQRGEDLLEDLSQSHRTELLRLRPMLQELLAGLG